MYIYFPRFTFCRTSPTSLGDSVLHLQMKVLSETHEYHVCRSEIFLDLLRETQKQSYSLFKLVTTYLIEKDTGGLVREMWSLFSKHL